MKLGTSLCYAVSLFLTVNQVSAAQQQDGSQQQNGNPQRYSVQLNPSSPVQGQSNQGPLTFDYSLPSPGQNQLQPLQVELGTDWERVLLTGNGQAWWGALNQGSGMSLAPADDALRDHLKLPKGQGLVVTAIEGNSPAAHAGIQQNDVLVMLGDAPLGKPEDLEENLKKTGEKPVSLSLIRGGGRVVLQVQPHTRVTLGPAQPKAAEHEYWIGVSIEAIEPALRSQLQIPSNAGVIVNQVINDSPAEKAGFKVHDIVLELDGKPLSDPHKLAEFVQAHGQKPIVASLLRAGGKQNVTVEVTPEQRKSTAGATLVNPAKSFYFVRPGAILTNPLSYTTHFASPGNVYEWTTNPAGVEANPIGQKPAEDASAAVSKRLDALDAEIKQLRKAVEGLSKTERIIEDLNKAVEALNKAAKENR